MEQASYYDDFAARYGWTIQETNAQPQWFLARAPWVWRAKAEVANANRG